MEALRARFHAMGLFSKWTHGAPCAVLWALESLPEELWARGVVCPAERAVMLGATSKRVRALLAPREAGARLSQALGEPLARVCLAYAFPKIGEKGEDAATLLPFILGTQTPTPQTRREPLHALGKLQRDLAEQGIATACDADRRHSRDHG